MVCTVPSLNNSLEHIAATLITQDLQDVCLVVPVHCSLCKVSLHPTTIDEEGAKASSS